MNHLRQHLATAVLLSGLMATPSAIAESCPAFLDHDQRKLHSSETVNLCEIAQGKPLLVVNTASHCGYTDQFGGLETLHKRYV